MPKVIMISDEVYNKLKPMTNGFGGRSPKKVGFSEVIDQALQDQDRYKKRRLRA